MDNIVYKEQDMEDMEVASRSSLNDSYSNNKEQNKGLKSLNNIILSNNNNNNSFDELINIKTENVTNNKIKLNFSVDRLLSIDKNYKLINPSQNQLSNAKSIPCVPTIGQSTRCKLECQSSVMSNPLLFHRRSILRPTPQYPSPQSVYHFPGPITASTLTNFQQMMAHETQCRAFKHHHPHSNHIQQQQQHHHHQTQTMLRQTITAIDTTNTNKTNENRSKKKRSWTRAVFSNLQRKGLEITFNQQKYITKPERRKLALRLGLSDGQVKVWFQNRRMKFRQANSKEQELIQGKKSITESNSSSSDEIDVVTE